MATEPQPKHRRRQRGALPVIAVLGLLATAAIWGVTQVVEPTPDTPDAAATSTQSAWAPPTPGDNYDPTEQTEVPGPPVGEADGLFTMWIPGLDTATQVVAITSNDDRVLLPPQDPLLAGWWRDGAAPGDERGSVVIAGHAVHEGESAFNDMASLRAGDEIQIMEESGVLWYRVSSVDVLSAADLADSAEELFAQDSQSRLAIVTCDDWDGEQFQSNVVVTAEPTG